MKKILQVVLVILIIILISRRAQSQEDCNIPSRSSVSISYDYTPNVPVGVNVRVGSIAQSGRLSGMVGFGIHHSKLTSINKDTNTYENKSKSQLSISTYLSYKIYHNEGVMSLHSMLSGHYYEQDGALWKVGMRMDIPAGQKAFYIYPSITSKSQPSIEMGVFFDL